MSGTVSTAQIANNAVTAAKLGTNEKLGLCKAFVNFAGTIAGGSGAGPAGSSIVVTSGSNQGTWNYTGAFGSVHLGTIYYFNIGGTNATLGGVNVSTVGVQINTVVSANQVTFTLLAGNATSSQTVNGNGSSTGYASSSSGIRSSYNVSSITKNGAGDYTVNFATPMSDASYTVAGSVVSPPANTDLWFSNGAGLSANPNSINSFRIRCAFASGITDGIVVSAQVFGN
jgi:hypothetical protein